MVTWTNINTNCRPYEFFFTIYMAFLPFQFVNLDPSYPFHSSRPLFQFLVLLFFIFLIGFLILCLWPCPNHLKRFSFILSQCLQLLNPFLYLCFELYPLRYIYSLSKHSHFHHSYLPTMILSKKPTFWSI